MLMLIFLFYMMIFFSKNLKNKKKEFNQPLECGFKNLEINQSSFSIYMYMHVILFLILDLEISVSTIFIMNFKSNFSPNTMFFFFSIILITTLEWKFMMMEWN